MAIVGPIASIGMGLLLGGLILSSAPGVDLMGRPWMAPNHLVRALVWMSERYLMIGRLGAARPAGSTGSDLRRYLNASLSRIPALASSTATRSSNSFRS